MGIEPRVREGGVDNRTQPVLAGRQHQRQRGPVAQPRAPSRRKAGQVGTPHQVEPFVEQRHHAPAPGRLGLEDDGKIQPACVEHRGQVARQALDQMHPHRRVALAQRGEQRQRQHRGGRRRHADADVARQACLAGRLHRAVGMADRELRLAQEGQAGFGGSHARGRALQQARREFTFQAADLLAQRGGHQSQVGRRAAHAAEIHDADEVAHLPQFHVKPSG